MIGKPYFNHLTPSQFWNAEGSSVVDMNSNPETNEKCFQTVERFSDNI
jgi:hypothetical protein